MNTKKTKEVTFERFMKYAKSTDFMAGAVVYKHFLISGLSLKRYLAR